MSCSGIVSLCIDIIGHDVACNFVACNVVNASAIKKTSTHYNH